MVEPFEIVTQAENRTGLLSDPYDLYLMRPETELFGGTEGHLLCLELESWT